MKKSILCIGLLLAGLTSCTNNEVVDVPQGQNSIQFKTPFVGKNTRATNAAVITTADVDHIHVFGKHIASDAEGIDGAQTIFTNTELSKSNSYTSDVAWEANKLYSFAAYIDGLTGTDQGTNANFELTSTTSSKFTISDYIVSDDDLVVAMPEDIRTTTTSNYPVPLTFVHMLSKIRFTFTNEEVADYTMNVTDIKINGGYKQGDLVVNKTQGGNIVPVWTTEGEASAYEYTNITGIQPAASDYTECFVIPQSIGSLNVTFTITLIDKNKSETTVKYTAPLNTGIVSWTPHYAYNYKLGISAHDVDTDLSEKIQFTLTVNTWDNQPDMGLNPSEVPNS